MHMICLMKTDKFSLKIENKFVENFIKSKYKNDKMFYSQKLICY